MMLKSMRSNSKFLLKSIISSQRCCATTAISSQILINFQRFAHHACQNKTFFQDTIETQKKDNIEFHDQELKMVAMKLPDGIFWPTFAESQKQAAEELSNVYFHRYGGIDDERYQFTLEILTSPRLDKVAWIGAPGIGKSTGVNYILYQLLANLGNGDFPKRVYYRLPDKGIFTFSKKDESDVIDVQVDSNLDTLPDLKKFEGLAPIKDNCMLIELGEDEVDPSSRMRAFVTTSSKDAINTLKSMGKSGLHGLLVGPPTKEQMYYIEKTRYEIKPESVWYMNENASYINENELKFEVNPDKKIIRVQNKAIPPSTSEEKTDKYKIFEKRFNIMMNVVGPIPRAFSLYREYAFRSEKITHHLQDHDLTKLSALDRYNIPSAFKNFLAPYPLDIYGDSSEFRVLSVKAVEALSRISIKMETYDLLSSVKINYRLAEHIISRAILTTNPYHNKSQRNGWEWVEDVGYKAELLLKNVLPSLPPPLNIPFCQYENIIPNIVLGTPAHELEENCLYFSSVHNFKLGDFIIVDHSIHTVYSLQVTLLNTNKHAVKVQVIEEVMNGLRILDKESKSFNYTLHLIFFIDKAIRNPTGSVFLINDDEKDKDTNEADKNYEKFTLEEWKAKDTKGIAEKVKTTIIRTPLSTLPRYTLPKVSISEDWKTLTKKDLIVICKSLGLAPQGNKDTLFEAIEEKIKNSAPERLLRNMRAKDIGKCSEDLLKHICDFLKIHLEETDTKDIVLQKLNSYTAN